MTTAKTIVDLVRASVSAEREACARVASHFTIKPDASIYPDVPFEKMPETAKTIAHMTAQNIAAAIRERSP